MKLTIYCNLQIWHWQYCKLGKVAHVLSTNFNIFDSLSLHKVCIFGKRRYNWLSPRLYTKSKKYLSPQLNTTFGSLM